MATLNTAALAPASTGYASSAVAPTITAPPVPAQSPTAGAQVRFMSPIIDIDPEAGLALLKVRDTESGEVEFQVPAERAVKEYRALAQDNSPAPTNRDARVETTSAAPAAAQTATVPEPRGTFETKTAKSGSSAAE